MAQQKNTFLTLAGILTCVVLLTSCSLFRPPKDPNQIQNPPPTDRNYLACKVNGKPVVFKSRWKWSRSFPSYFEIVKDTINNKSLIKIGLQGDNSTAFDDSIELYIFGEINVDNSLYEEKDIIQAELKQYYTPHTDSSNHRYKTKSFDLTGSIQISHFDYAIDPKTDKPKGRVSGSFKLMSIPSDTNSDDQITITDGVFNITRIGNPW